MKSLIILSICAAAVLAAPLEDSGIQRASPALEHIDERDELGQYTLKYVTAEGTIVSERGRLVPNADGTDQVLIYEGEFEFKGDDGKIYVTKYTTDVTGAHQPKGDHLPKNVEPEIVPEAKEIMVASA